jgi:hypothetical protein
MTRRTSGRRVRVSRLDRLIRDVQAPSLNVPGIRREAFFGRGKGSGLVGWESVKQGKGAARRQETRGEQRIAEQSRAEQSRETTLEKQGLAWTGLGEGRFMAWSALLVPNAAAMAHSSSSARPGISRTRKKRARSQRHHVVTALLSALCSLLSALCSLLSAVCCLLSALCCLLCHAPLAPGAVPITNRSSAIVAAPSADLIA